MIDIEKFICSLLADHPEGITVRNDIHKALKEQGLEYKDGKIVPIEDKTELKESEDERDERIRKWIINEIKIKHHNLDEKNVDFVDKAIAWLEKQGEQKPVEWTADDEEELKIALDTLEEAGQYSSAIWLKNFCLVPHTMQKPADKVKPFNKYEGLTDFERTLADICIGWIGEELGWKQYIKDNADILLKIAIKKFNSVQDAHFEQKPIERKDFISIPFGAFDSELIEESITIPDGCVATIEGNKIHIKRQGKSATEAIKEENNDNANKVEPQI